MSYREKYLKYKNKYLDLVKIKNQKGGWKCPVCGQTNGMFTLQCPGIIKKDTIIKGKPDDLIDSDFVGIGCWFKSGIVYVGKPIIPEYIIGLARSRKAPWDSFASEHNDAQPAHAVASLPRPSRVVPENATAVGSLYSPLPPMGMPKIEAASVPAASWQPGPAPRLPPRVLSENAASAASWQPTPRPLPPRVLSENAAAAASQKWECDNCWFMNPYNSRECLECGRANPNNAVSWQLGPPRDMSEIDAAAAPASWQPGPAPRPLPPRVMSENAASAASRQPALRMLPENAAAAASQQWDCANCTFINPNNSRACEMCGSANPNNIAALPAAAAASEWNCSACTFANQNSDRRCGACDSAKPSEFVALPSAAGKLQAPLNAASAALPSAAGKLQASKNAATSAALPLRPQLMATAAASIIPSPANGECTICSEVKPLEKLPCCGQRMCVDCMRILVDKKMEAIAKIKPLELENTRLERELQLLTEGTEQYREKQAEIHAKNVEMGPYKQGLKLLNYNGHKNTGRNLFICPYCLKVVLTDFGPPLTLSTIAEKFEKKYLKYKNKYLQLKKL